MRATNMLRRFVLIGGFDIDDAYDTDTQDGMEASTTRSVHRKGVRLV